MSVTGNDLLKNLGSVNRPGVGVPAVGGNAGGAIEAEFASLLSRAREGALDTGRPVTVDRGVKVRLTGDDAARVSRAADRAQSQGIAHAAVILDGRVLLLDVDARRVTGVLDPASSGVSARIDGVVVAGAIDDSAPAAGQDVEASATREELLSRLRRPQVEGLIRGEGA